MFGIKEFTAIINPPQCAIMAVGSGSIEIDPETGKPFTGRFYKKFCKNCLQKLKKKILLQNFYKSLNAENLKTRN